jgi:AcrR family transcriptional regulator
VPARTAASRTTATRTAKKPARTRRTKQPASESAYLDKAALARAAADIADRDGWSKLTLTRVAKEVDRHVTSLYGHVGSLDALRREIAILAVDELADRVWEAALGRSRGDALMAIAAVERDYCRAHPGRIMAAVTYRAKGDEEWVRKATRLAEPVRATFRSFGLNDEQVAQAHSVFSTAVRGLVVAETTSSFPFDDVDRTLQQMVDVFVVALSTGQWPSVD